MAGDNGSVKDLEKRLWDAADELRANSKLKSHEYSSPVLGLIFLKYADHRFAVAQQEIGGWSLNPGRYVGVADAAEDDFDFYERLEEQNEKPEKLNVESHELEERIGDNVTKLMETE
jgi:type I restriction-modification system DNA methylase subunit